MNIVLLVCSLSSGCDYGRPMMVVQPPRYYYCPPQQSQQPGYTPPSTTPTPRRTAPVPRREETSSFEVASYSRNQYIKKDLSNNAYGRIETTNGVVEQIHFNEPINSMKRVSAKSHRGTFTVPVLNGIVPEVMEYPHSPEATEPVEYRYFYYNKGLKYSAYGQARGDGQVVYARPGENIVTKDETLRTESRKEPIVRDEKPSAFRVPQEGAGSALSSSSPEDPVDRIMRRLDQLEDRIKRLEK